MSGGPRDGLAHPPHLRRSSPSPRSPVLHACLRTVRLVLSDWPPSPCSLEAVVSLLVACSLSMLYRKAIHPPLYLPTPFSHPSSPLPLRSTLAAPRLPYISPHSYCALRIPSPHSRLRLELLPPPAVHDPCRILLALPIVHSSHTLSFLVPRSRSSLSQSQSSSQSQS